jgi:Tfp pilus assembly protein PilF
MQELLDQASEAHKRGDLAKAEQLYQQILSREPEQPVICARLASVLVQTKRAREALPLFSIAINGLPTERQLLVHAASIASQLGENSYAENWIGKLRLNNPGNLELDTQYAGILIANHKEKEALQLINQMLKNAPQNAQLYNLKGMALSRLSEGDKAYKCFQKSVSLNPGQIGTVRNLLVHAKGRKEPVLDSIMPQFEQQLVKGALDPSARMNIAYVLSMYYGKRGEDTKSFDYLKMGNDLNRSTYRYSHDQTKNDFEMLIKALDDDLVAALSEQAIEDDSPIFILGMPRSGTTLIEQILSSHSQVIAEGELQTLRQCFEARAPIIFGAGDVGERIQAVLAVFYSYLEQVKSMQAVRGDTEVVHYTDKMPYNFMFAGFIAAVMPNARIIHCTRDPMETCYSIYKQNFSGSHAYKNDLKELGMYFNLYQEMMAHWCERFPDQIYDANYEKMVAQSEEEIPRLLSFCGLEVEKDCLMFHKNKRTVRTASIAQVRQPIYKDALKASRSVVKQLQPLKAVLDANDGVLSR